MLATAVVACTSLATLAAAAPNASAETGTLEGTQAAVRTVTLITGDRVTVAGTGTSNAVIEPAEGRARVRFITYRSAGDLHVVPMDAMALLGAGQLDARLFNVTTLLEFGYDDRRTDLPLIVTHGSGASLSAARSTVTLAGAAVVRDLPAVAGFAVKAAKKDATAFWSGLTTGDAAARGLRADLSKVWLDGIRKPTGCQQPHRPIRHIVRDRRRQRRWEGDRELAGQCGCGLGGRSRGQE
jgi:hypothetical protein